VTRPCYGKCYREYAGIFKQLCKHSQHRWSLIIIPRCCWRYVSSACLLIFRSRTGRLGDARDANQTGRTRRSLPRHKVHSKGASDHVSRLQAGKRWNVLDCWTTNEIEYIIYIFSYSATYPPYRYLPVANLINCRQIYVLRRSVQAVSSMKTHSKESTHSSSHKAVSLDNYILIYQFTNLVGWAVLGTEWIWQLFMRSYARNLTRHQQHRMCEATRSVLFLSPLTTTGESNRAKKSYRTMRNSSIFLYVTDVKFITPLKTTADLSCGIESFRQKIFSTCFRLKRYLTIDSRYVQIKYCNEK